MAGFVGRRILSVSGNTKQPKERLQGKILRDIFSYGKYLNFQLDGFALRIHFMLFGSFRLDEPRPAREPRLAITVKGHCAYFYACSVKFVEAAALKNSYDYRSDIMSAQWDRREVLRRIHRASDLTLDDLLMNQEVFTGLGNIMKNEILWRQRLLPMHRVDALSPYRLGRLVSDVHAYAWLFYELKKKYMLRKSYKIYRQGKCPRGCGARIVHVKTGARQRMSHYCPVCQL